MTTKNWWRVFWGALLLVPVLYLAHYALREKQHKQKLQETKIFFEELCKKEAGEFIYKTVDNVDGIFQMRPRDGSKDYFDRIRAKDYPEDPYGHTNLEAQHPDWLFVDNETRYMFLETPLPSGIQINVPGAKYRRFTELDNRSSTPTREEQVIERRSKYGYTWRSIKRAEFNGFGIYGGETIVVDLQTNEVLAIKRGFINLQTLGICPADKDDRFVYRFIAKVLKPASAVKANPS